MAEDMSSLCFIPARDAVEVLAHCVGVHLHPGPDTMSEALVPDVLDALLERYMTNPPSSLSMDTDFAAGVHSV